MIDAAELRERCLAFPGSAKTFSFDLKTSMFKVGVVRVERWVSTTPRISLDRGGNPDANE